MPKKKKKNNADSEQQVEKEEPKKKKKRERKKRNKKPPKKIKLSEKDLKKKAEIENNVYNLLFDDINLFLNEIPHMSMKSLRQKLVLIDGKLLWVEKHTEMEFTEEEGSEDIIDLEMQMLEMGVELETAEEMKMAFTSDSPGFDLEAFKDEIEETKTFGDNIKDILKDFEDDNIEKPIDDLMSKFILYDLRASIERAINEVFRLEGKIKKLKKQEGQEKKVQELESEQKKVTRSNLKDMITKLKKEKPKLILPEEKIAEFKKLTKNQIAAMKAKEEKALEEMVGDLLKE
ncbi:MAG: hypothetical protein HZR80_17795 [Candidatus Heimdallarchaeota archaeon]